MKTPIIVNESVSIERTGDIYVFNSIRKLESYFEPWYVDEPHFIFDSDGMQLAISPNRHQVSLAPKEPRSFNPGIARTYFANFLRAFDPSVTDDFLRTATLSELAQASTRFADG